jgi:serine/threonine protein kinase
LQHQHQQQQQGKAVELGAGGNGVVYLLEQQAPLNLAYPRQVAFKVPFLGSTSSLVGEYQVLTHLRGDLVNVVQLLGKAQGSCGGTAVTGLVYEYCPVSDMRDWASNLLLQAAQQPELDEELEEAAAVVLKGAGMISWDRSPPWYRAGMDRHSTHERPAWKATQVSKLRQAVVEPKLKQHVKQLLQLLIAMSSSSTSSSSSSRRRSSRGSSSRAAHPSATVPPGGLVIHADVKASNLYFSSNGTVKLGDWGAAMYIPSAAPQQLLIPPGYTMK